MSRKTSGRSLFILEIVILFVLFIISIVVCVSLFVSASSKNHQANDLNSAVIKAVTIADTIKSCGGDVDQAKQRLNADSDFHIYYDAQWNTGKEKVYQAAITYQIKSGMLTAVIQFLRIGQSEPIYSLEIKEFLQEDMP